MGARDEKVYQFKITLRNIEPPIWRRILVPSWYTFWELHVAVQDAMGWCDSHLHEFEMLDPETGEADKIGTPHNDFPDGLEIVPEITLPIARYFTLDNATAGYRYDFGDGWRHTILLEKILSKGEGARPPVCLEGERACPPEDCGGTWGYMEFLRKIKGPTAEDHEWMLEWAGGPFDPEAFDPEAVHFDDPTERLERALSFG